MRRRLARRTAVAALTVAGVLGVGQDAAQAQVILDQDAEAAENRGDTSASPQTFAAEIRFGAFRPDVDSEFTSSAPHPYSRYFGKADRLLTQLELDWQILHRSIGSLAVGASVGYFKATGTAPLADGTGPSGDSTTLTLYPTSVAAVFRLDHLALRRGIPLVPFAKVGLDYTLWSITDGNGKTPTDSAGHTGRGGTLGWHAAAGLALLLDVFEPGSARELDSEVGVNHTYIFFEAAHYQIHGLASSKPQFRVGDPFAWCGGLMFEF